MPNNFDNRMENIDDTENDDNAGLYFEEDTLNVVIQEKVEEANLHMCLVMSA